MIELVTPVCQDLHELEDFLRKKLRLLEDFVSREGFVVFPASLHPFARAEEQIVYDDPRYKAIFEELQLVGRRFIAQGLHIHLGMPNEETALKLYNAILAYLPLLLALTTSSPFYEGQNTGFHSYRTKLFEVLPLAGLPRRFSDWQEYEGLLEFLKDRGIITTIRDLWWDVRIQPTLGTVEVRIFDVPGILAVVGFTRVLAEEILAELSPPPLPREVHLYGKWQAARHGLDGSFVHPLEGQRRPILATLQELHAKLRPRAEKLGLGAHWEMLAELLRRKPISYRILALHRTGATFAEIITILKREFWT